MDSPLAPFPMVALIGPTAIGKTDLSLRLAQELNGEIIGVDSVQVYKRLDIGSAKPTREERSQVVHHLIDEIEPDEPFDAADFVRRARGLIKNMVKRGKVPLLVGGTGLYLKALLEGLAPCPGGDPLVRERLDSIRKEYGLERLYHMLADVDPETAGRIHPNDKARIIRALEVFEITGKPISAWHKKTYVDGGQVIPCIKVGLVRPRKELYDRIEKRVDQMMKEGFLEEVRSILESGFSPELKPLQSLGYRHMILHLSGKCSIEEAVRLLKRDTRRYAKRQLTWFRADPQVRWFNPDYLLGQKEIWPVIMGGYRP